MAQKFCTYCGAELKPDLKFCPKCGKPIRQLQQEAVEEEKTGFRISKELLQKILPKVFRIWDIVGSCVPLILWAVAFIISIASRVYISVGDDYRSFLFFYVFRNHEIGPAMISIFVLYIVQLLFMGAYTYLVVKKGSKIGRIFTGVVSFGLSLALLLLQFINMYSTGLEVGAILECVIIGLFVIGIVVSIKIKGKPKEE